MVLLDELSTGLDPEARRGTWELVEDVRASGTTVVLVTHLMEEAERLCDRVVLVAGGRVVAEGTPDDVVRGSGAPTVMTFRTEEPPDACALEAIPGVRSVRLHGAQVEVQADDDGVAGVLTHLHAAGTVPPASWWWSPRRAPAPPSCCGCRWPVADGPEVVRVVVVDDHPVVRDGLRGMLSAAGGLEVVGEAADGVEALAVARRTRPDVVLMDLRMPGGDGVTATAALRRTPAEGAPAPQVLVLTTYATAREVHAALEAGAIGYVLKDAPRDELFAAVRAAARGESVLSAAAATQVVSRLRGEPESELTERELAVLELVARGTANRVIASTLFVSEATVKTHLAHVFAKLGVVDRAAAVAAGYERGLLG